MPSLKSVIASFMRSTSERVPRCAGFPAGSCDPLGGTPQQGTVASVGGRGGVCGAGRGVCGTSGGTGGTDAACGAGTGGTDAAAVTEEAPAAGPLTHTVKDGEDIVHHARIVTYVDTKKTRARLVSLLTNDMEMGVEDIVAVYRKRWEIELLFKQLKQNFPLRYFYGESANAIKIQIWVTLIANLLLMVIQKRIRRTWSFSGLATMFRIMLLCQLLHLLRRARKGLAGDTQDNRPVTPGANPV